MYSMMMDKIWKTRGDSDRVRVVHDVTREFVEVLADMRDCGQIFQEPSHDYEYNF